MRVAFSTIYHPRILSWSCPQILSVDFGQLLERAMILIGGARSFPGLQWKHARSSSSGALVVYPARTVLQASSQSQRLQLQPCSLHPQL